MKKLIILLFFIMVIAVGINEEENILIPDNAIRFRVIANSNKEEDQKVKREIKDKIGIELYKIVEEADSIDEARELITRNLNQIDDMLIPYNISYDINFGNNYFPIKNYKGITYDAGNYESLVITLGEGLGENWWCVIFPPLCLLDQNNNIKDAEYKLYAEKLINKFRN